MEETISVRIPRRELKEIEQLSKYVKLSRSAILRNILEMGVKQKMLEVALDKFQKNEITASKAASIAGISLSDFLDILKEKGINFHYGIEELREDFEGLIEK